ncbi:hypothetical protein AMTR_s00025p00202950 [Amborella trichopoda]|uniref:Uncharacterized protein n=1 Tax=Amborella trichopoda TaxID=13333 RepID=W1PYG4_AMBTC|nr:hypothetical protein AMTR_s00025p00202950 [Amborella trichopoda]
MPNQMHLSRRHDCLPTQRIMQEHETATRGRRHKPAARAVGEGIYRIVWHKSKNKVHTHLIYKLEMPSQSDKREAEESLNIASEASFVIQIKNPEQPSPPSVGLQSERKPMFPAHLQENFGNRRYAPADPPDFLNYERCEFLLIGASDDIEEELGLELKPEVPQNTAFSDIIKMFGDSVSVKPLLEGTWA